MPELKHTPLFATHQKYGARLVPFAGWTMPIQYKSGIIDEHKAVRNKAGIFDVSHMGEIRITGVEALNAVQYLTTNDAESLSVGQAQYSLLCTPKGTIVDDIIVYRMAENDFLLCVNASNAAKDFDWIAGHVKTKQLKAECRDESALWGQLAIQGPAIKDLSRRHFPERVQGLKAFEFCETTVFGVNLIVARTGYTGEFGFEIFVPWEKTQILFDHLMETGQPLGLTPVGLGARDTLRLEMKYPLYGNDLDENHTALEGNLGWVIKLGKRDFIGKEALLKEKTAGIQRKWVGFLMQERGIPRQGYRVFDQDNRVIGEVTSGTHSPCLDLPIGTAYVNHQFSAVGSPLMVEIRGAKVKAQVVKTPFYQVKL